MLWPLAAGFSVGMAIIGWALYFECRDRHQRWMIDHGYDPDTGKFLPDPWGNRAGGN